MDVISIIISAGKSSVDVALYTLLPIMVVMLIIMKYLSVRGVLDVIVRWLAPLLKPFGLTGMSAFALIQINFVSFAAPLATLAIMDKRGVSDRHMAATHGDVFCHGAGNVFYPLMPFGLHWTTSIIISVAGIVCGGFYSGMSPAAGYPQQRPQVQSRCRMQSRIIREFCRLSTARGGCYPSGTPGAIPMLILSLSIVGLMQAAGVIEWLHHILMPVLNFMHIPDSFVLPAR